jgi:hypothetical protein
MNHKKFDFRTAYIDLLLNVLTGIIFLFAITTMMIQAKKQNEGIKKDAQYVIIATWDPKVDCDVDLWVQDPNGDYVFFNRRDFASMHIERDDMGRKNDTIRDKDNNVIGIVDKNEENWVLRGIVPGEFYVSVHLYSCRYPNLNPLQAFAMALKTPVDLPVKVELIKLNPTYKSIITETVTLRKIWDEETPFNFVLNSDGSVESTNRDIHKLVKQEKQQ